MSLIKNVLLKNYINDIYEASDGFFLSMADEIDFDDPREMYSPVKLHMADKYGLSDLSVPEIDEHLGGIMNIYQIIGIIGIPSILTIVGFIYTREKSLMLGVQALFRAEMINDYYKYMEKGYAPLHVKENFENCYKQYHTLGANGFMDKLRDEFLALPISNDVKK